MTIIRALFVQSKVKSTCAFVYQKYFDEILSFLGDRILIQVKCVFLCFAAYGVGGAWYSCCDQVQL